MSKEPIPMYSLIDGRMVRDQEGGCWVDTHDLAEAKAPDLTAADVSVFERGVAEGLRMADQLLAATEAAPMTPAMLRGALREMGRQRAELLSGKGGKE